MSHDLQKGRQACEHLTHVFNERRNPVLIVEVHTQSAAKFCHGHVHYKLYEICYKNKAAFPCPLKLVKCLTFGTLLVIFHHSVRVLTVGVIHRVTLSCNKHPHVIKIDQTNLDAPPLCPLPHYLHPLLSHTLVKCLGMISHSVA